MSMKSKGTNAERELIRLFWGAGWAAIRSAGSGSMHYPSPDILAGNRARRLAIEAKVTKEDKKYFTGDDFKDLLDFSSYFGAEPWIAIKFKGCDWIFINPEDLRETKKNYVISKENSNSIGVTFEELILSSYS